MGEPDNVTINGKGRRCFRFAPLDIGRLRRAGDSASYHLCCRYAVTEEIVGILDNWLAVGGDGEAAAEGVVGVGGCEYSSLETAALFADGLGEKILVMLGEARRAGRLAIDCTRPARAVWEYAVGVKLGGDGGAGNGENVA